MEEASSMAGRDNEHYAVSDLHGYPDALLRLLREQHLVDDEGSWSGERATLWLLGDYVDHGPDGMGVIDAVMRLQDEAAGAGGRVIALLGNHDLLLLAAERFGAQPRPSGGTFLSRWEESHGRRHDLEALTPAQAEWLSGLSFMARLGASVLAHADASFYGEYGMTVEAINRRLCCIVQAEDRDAWDMLLEGIDRHRAFLGPSGEQRAAAFLAPLQAGRLVHGHTPIAKITQQAPETVRAPYAYAGGRCLNIDGGIYLGGSGIIQGLER
jgi:calcineurin-like phosphoesterase family protein